MKALQQLIWMHYLDQDLDAAQSEPTQRVLIVLMVGFELITPWSGAWHFTYKATARLIFVDMLKYFVFVSKTVNKFKLWKNMANYLQL